MVPYMLLLTTITMMLAPYCLAVASSCPFIMKQPSPAKAMTVRFGSTSLAATAAGVP
ncbi:hypothetical protein D3C80_2010440 [compost metagenome]